MLHQDFVNAVTDFIFVSHTPEPSDLILVPGSLETGHVMKAADLYHAGFAPSILCSGSHPIGQEHFALYPEFQSEADYMAHLLLEQNVPEHAILREDRSTYTWENAMFSAKLLNASLNPRQIIIACKPSHARRCLFYFQQAMPHVRFLICPCSQPGLYRDDWFLTTEGRRHVLGEVRRMGDQVLELFEESFAE